MSLPDRTAVKLRLRIENDVEDDDIDLMILAATATIIEFVGRPLQATSFTWLIETPSPNADRSCLQSDRLFLPLYPVDADTVTIADADDEAVTDFRVVQATGMIVATNDAVFNNFPYEVTADVGLELMWGYATRIEPKLSQAFLDLCADWYQRRNPNASMEAGGGGVVTQYAMLGVPERVCRQLEPYRLGKAY